MLHLGRRVLSTPTHTQSVSATSECLTRGASRLVCLGRASVRGATSAQQIPYYPSSQRRGSTSQIQFVMFLRGHPRTPIDSAQYYPSAHMTPRAMIAGE